MAFPTIPTVAAGRVLTTTQADANNPRTFPSLTGLTKNSGDLLIAIIVAYQSSASPAFSSWGGSFTEFHDSGSGSTLAIGMAYKWSSGSETGTFTVTQGGTITGHAAMILLSIPGAHASTPPEAGGRADHTSSRADPSALDPSGWAAEDTLWIALGGVGENSTGGAWTGIAVNPSGTYTDYADTGVSADAVGAVEAAVRFRQLNASSEDVGADEFLPDLSNARNSAVVIAVRPVTAIVYNDSPSGTVLGSGTRTESYSHSPTPSGTALGSGTRSESLAHSSNPTGTVLASGSITESWYVETIYTDEPAGTILASGSVVESCGKVVTLVPTAALWDPTQIAGLQVWLDASQIVGLNDGDAVAQWDDESGNGLHAYQSVAERKPVYKTNIVDGKPVVRFNGTTAVLNVWNAGIGLTEATAFIVLKADNDPAIDSQHSGLWAWTNSGNASAYPTDGGVLQDNFASATRHDVDPTPSLAAWRVYSVRASSEWTNWLDGNQLLSTAHTFSIPDSGEIGGRFTYGNHFDGDIAEFLLFESALSEADRQDVEGYLADKYGLGFGTPPEGKTDEAQELFKDKALALTTATETNQVQGLDVDKHVTIVPVGGGVYREEVLADSPLAFFEDASAAPWDDEQGGTDMTIIGATANQPGPFGDTKAFSFDGTDDEGGVTFAPSGTAVTFECWFLLDGSPAGDAALMHVTGTGPTPWTIIPKSAGSQEWEIIVNSGAGQNAFRWTRPSSGTWHHLVVVIDTSLPVDDEIVAYLNGELWTPTSHPVAYNQTFSWGSVTATFMRYPLYDKLAGDLALVAFYNSALSAERIAAHYASRFADIAQPLDADKHVALTAASQTDQAQPLSFIKTIYKTLVPATETDAAQTLSIQAGETILPAEETDAAQTLTHFKSITPSPAITTDAAQPLDFSKTIYKTLIPATGSDGAQALSYVKTIYKTLAPAAETDAARVLSYWVNGYFAAAETDAAQPVTYIKQMSIGVAVESDTVLAFTATVHVTITTAAEGDSAEPLTAIKPISKGVTTTSDAAIGIDGFKRISITAALETCESQPLVIATNFIQIWITAATGTDTAQLLRRPNLIAVVSTDTAQSLDFSKTIYKVFIPATETDAAQTIIYAQASDYDLTATSEIDAAQMLTATKSVAVLPTAESDGAQALAAIKPIYKTLTTVSEADSAQSLVATKRSSIGVASEANVAQAITVTKPIHKALGVAVGTDAAQALTKSKSLGSAIEIDTAQIIISSRILTLSPALEVHQAQVFSFEHRLNLGSPLEVDTAQPLFYTKPFSLLAASQTDVSQAINVDKIISVSPTTEVDRASNIDQISPGIEIDQAQALVLRGYGSASEVDIASALSVNRPAPLISASETDTACPLISFTSAKETDVAQALRVPRVTPAIEVDNAYRLNKQIAPGQTTDVVQSLSINKSSRLTASGESDVAQVLSVFKLQTRWSPALADDEPRGLIVSHIELIAGVTETDQAQALSITKVYFTESTQETNSAQELFVYKLTPVLETNEAQVLVPAWYGPGLETDEAQLLFYGEIFPGLETDIAQAKTWRFAPHRIVDIIPVWSLEIAQGLSTFKKETLSWASEGDAATAISKNKIKELTPAVESNATRYLVVSRTMSISSASEIDNGAILNAFHMATTIDLAHALTSGKLYSITPANEVNQTQIQIATHNVNLGFAIEIDNAQEAKLYYLVIGSETDSAQVLEVHKLSLASEVDEAQSLIYDKHSAITPASEADASTALATGKYAPLTSAIATEAAQALDIDKSVALVSSVEIDEAQSTRISVPIIIVSVSETSSAIALSINKHFSIISATETETTWAIAFSFGTPIVASAEIDTAVTTIEDKLVRIAVTNELDYAYPLAIRQRIMPANELDQASALKIPEVLAATETDIAQSLIIVHAVTLDAATETSLPLLTFAKHILLTFASEVDESVGLYVSRNLSVDWTQEIDLIQALAFSFGTPIEPAAQTETSPIIVAYKLSLRTSANETDVSPHLDIDKITDILTTDEIDTAALIGGGNVGSYSISMII